MYVMGVQANACIYCGNEVAEGDPVYDTGEGLVHDECFYDYMRQYARDSGWRRFDYGEEEAYDD
jgi:hypothetical protein